MNDQRLIARIAEASQEIGCAARDLIYSLDFDEGQHDKEMLSTAHDIRQQLSYLVNEMLLLESLNNDDTTVMSATNKCLIDDIEKSLNNSLSVIDMITDNIEHRSCTESQKFVETLNMFTIGGFYTNQLMNMSQEYSELVQKGEQLSYQLMQERLFKVFLRMMISYEGHIKDFVNNFPNDAAIDHDAHQQLVAKIDIIRQLSDECGSLAV